MSIYIKHRQTSLYLSGFHLNTCKRNKDWVQVQSHLTDSIRSGKLCRILDEAVYTKQAEVPTSINAEVSWRRCWFCQLSPLTYKLRVIGKHVRLNSPVCKHADNKYLLNLHPLLFPLSCNCSWCRHDLPVTWKKPLWNDETGNVRFTTQATLDAYLRKTFTVQNRKVPTICTCTHVTHWWCKHTLV